MSALARLFQSPFIVGVDIGSHFTKVVEVHAFSRFRATLRGSATVPTPAGAYVGGIMQDPASVGKAIREALREGNIRARRAAVAVHAQAAFLRKLSFPTMPPEELRNVIALQPDRYLPIAAAEEAQYDFVILPHEPGEEQMSIILAGASKSVVSGLMRACRAAGLRPVAVDLEPLALQRAVVAARRDVPDGATAIIDLAGDMAKITLFERNVPVISRVMEVSGSAPAESQPGDPEAAGPQTEALFLDIRRSLEYALSQTASPLARIFLAGGSLFDEDFPDLMAEYLRGFMSHRLTPEFTVEPLRHPFLTVSPSHMLALGLSLPQELFYDSNQPAD